MTPALLEAIIVGAVKYGPEFAQSVIALFKQQTITVDDVEKLFANVKPWDAYGIQATKPAAPTA